MRVDAQAGEYGNLISKGIIDPTKLVARGATTRSVDRRPAHHHRSHGPGGAEERGPAMPGGGAAGWAAWTSKRANNYREQRPGMPGLLRQTSANQRFEICLSRSFLVAREHAADATVVPSGKAMHPIGTAMLPRRIGR